MTTVCADCRRPYGDPYGFPDLIIPNVAWREISPTGDEGGLLCPSCILARLYEAGLCDVPAALMSGPAVTVSQEEMQNLRERENSEGGGRESSKR